jgi:hypothetical protein
MTEPRMRWCYFVLDAGRSVRPKEGPLRILIAHCKATSARYFCSQQFLLINIYLHLLGFYYLKQIQALCICFEY